MPCYDGMNNIPELPADYIVNSKMAAVLCSLVTRLGPDAIVRRVDWDKAGVSPMEFLKWWDAHLAQDEHWGRNK